MALKNEIPSFLTDHFTDNSGTISIKDGGVSLNKINTINSMKLLGNVSGDVGSISQVSILDEVNMQSNSAVSVPTQQSVKAYVDSVASGLDVKKSCRVATIENITLAGIQTIDTITLNVGDRVLVKDQSNPNEKDNGIYICEESDWTRATDFDNDSEVTSGAFTFIEEGNVNADIGYAYYQRRNYSGNNKFNIFSIL